MATMFSAQDIELLGYSRPQIISQNPHEPWIIYEATAVAGLDTIKASFLYLKSDCTLEAARRAASHLPRSNSVYVLKAKSLPLRDKALSAVFPETKLFVHEELIWNTLSSAFSEYLASLREGIVPERYYVPPRSSNPDIGDKLAERVFDYLAHNKKPDEGQLLVLSANAGVGKTTLARYLVKKLIGGGDRKDQHQTIPVYVEAQHWGKLQLDSVDELWEIIENSLRTFSVKLQLREELFRHALKEGYISFVFDGFDELCGHRSSHFSARAVLQALADIAKDSSARIVITTRSLFWQSEIGQGPANVLVENIDYFNTQQAKGYFRKYFSQSKENQNKALQLYGDLVADSHRPRDSGGARAQFVNLPLCVAILAEYIDQGGEALHAEGGRQLLENVLLQICERDKERKTLRTRAAEQLRAFQEIAVSEPEAENPEFELEFLSAAGFEEADVRKLIDHPLLAIGDGGSYRFSYDFLAPYLRALRISDVLLGEREVTDSVLIMMAKEANGRGFMLEHLVTLLEPRAVNYIARMMNEMKRGHGESKCFLFHLAQGLIRDDPSITTATERAEALFSAVEGEAFVRSRSVQGFYFTGVLDRLDLTGLAFHNCKFHDVTFKNCKADGDTRFIRCTFSGAFDFEPTSMKGYGWADSRLQECTILFPASATWDRILVEPVTSREELARDALKLGLGKFWYHGRLKMSLKVDDWNKGMLRHSGYGEKLIKVLMKAGAVEKIHISGVGEGGYVFDKDSLGDLQKFMDNQQLGGKIREAFELLCQG